MEILARAKALEQAGMDVIHLEIGEPDFPTPPAILEAGMACLREGSVRYTAAGGMPELREAISGHYACRYGLTVSPDRIFVTPGASGALVLAMALLQPHGQEVLVADPGYPCYPNFVRVFGGIPRQIPVDEASLFQLDAKLLESAWNPLAAGAVIGSPGNPTGTRLPAASLAAVAEFLDHRDGFLIADEIYHGLEYGPPSPSALQFSNRAFVVNSFSKYFGMTGWRLGWLIVPEAAVEQTERLAQNLFIAAPTHSQAAALAAFSSENLAELERRRSIFEERRDLICAGLENLGFKIHAKPEGAFYVWVDCSGLTEDSREFAEKLLSGAGVAVTPGLDFGSNRPERNLRFCYATSAGRIVEALERIDHFLHR